MKDYFKYTGKTCVITGASSGMGKSTEKLLVEMGADVYVLDCIEPEVDGIKTWIQTDLAIRASIDNAFIQLPKHIDRFFGFAGVSRVAHTYEEIFIIDFVANKYITEAYLENRVTDGGAIAYITSSSRVRWARPDIINEYKA